MLTLFYIYISSTIDVLSLFMKVHSLKSLSTYVPFALVTYFASLVIHLYRVVLLFSQHCIPPTTISQLLIPTCMGISGEFCIYVVFFLYFCFANGSIRNLFTSSLHSQT